MNQIDFSPHIKIYMFELTMRFVVPCLFTDPECYMKLYRGRQNMISSPRQTTLSPNLDSTTQNKKCISDIMQEISYQSHN